MNKSNLRLGLTDLLFSKCCQSVIVFLVSGLLVVTAPLASDLVFDSDTSSIRSPGVSVDDNSVLSAYTKPNQSRIWYNSHQDRWDALIPKDDDLNNNNGGISASDHFIIKDVTGSQVFTSVELEDRDFARPDVFWDDASRKLYVLASHPVRSEFWRLAYNELSDTYGIETGVARTGIEVPGIIHPNTSLGANSPASLYVTPNGDVWVAVMGDNGLTVQHSANGGATWMTSPVTLDATARTGVTTWIDFQAQGQTLVGVFAGENGIPGQQSDFFFWYIEQNANAAELNNWLDDSSNIPAPIGVEQADDHVSSARDVSGNMYFAVKTENGAPTDPLIKLYKRTPLGTWSQHKVTEMQDVPEESRPSLVIDETNDRLMIYSNGAEIVSQSEREGSRVVVPLNALGQLSTAPFTPLFSEPGKIFTDLITPRQAVNISTGVVVLAHNRSDANLWFHADSLGTSGTTVVGNFQNNFRGGSPEAGWQYLWNANGPIGAASNYVGLQWNGGLYDSDGSPGLPDASELAFGHLSTTGGHPGEGDTQGAAEDRYVIAAYTTQAVGDYSITASQIGHTGCPFGNGGEIRVYVGDNLVRSNLFGSGGGTSFDGSLGAVNAGDTIYVAAGPNGNHGCDAFAWDFSIEVADGGTPVNLPPTLDNPGDQANLEGDAVSLTLDATDANGDTLSFSATGLPPGLTISSGSGIISGTVAAGSAGDYNVSVSVADGQGGNASVNFAWMVTQASSGVVVADYQDDFQSGIPLTGWRYLWNANTPIGTASGYVDLQSNGGIYDADGVGGLPDASELAFGHLSSTGGHPGEGDTQGAAEDRYVIAAYTTQAVGDYSITASQIGHTGCPFGNGGEIRLYVNDNLIRNQFFDQGGQAVFDGPIGALNAGDSIYIGVGPNGGDGCDAFALDFTIELIGTN